MAKLIGNLMQAVIDNQLDKVVYYLAQRVDPNGYEDSAKVRPLHIAVINNAFACIEILLAFGANPFTEDSDGVSPFELASERDAHQVLALFRNFKFDDSKILH